MFHCLNNQCKMQILADAFNEKNRNHQQSETDVARYQSVFTSFTKVY